MTPQKYSLKSPHRKFSGWPIRSFYPFNYPLNVPWLFPFHHPEFSSARRTGRDKVQFFMRRQHQVVALASPSNVIAKPASISRFTLVPLNRDVFIESSHALPSGKAFYSSRSLNQRNEANAGKLRSESCHPRRVFLNSSIPNWCYPCSSLIGFLLFSASVASF
jgi:hypothetical protein